MDDLKDLYQVIPIGKANAKPIFEIAFVWGVPERTARKLIEQMIYKELYVVNVRSGYFRPAVREELEAYSNIIHSYKLKFEKKAYRLRKGLEQWDNVKMNLEAL
jgi:hypothetical protein